MNDETLEYRLNNIEATLVELKNLITETKLQQKDIVELKEDSKKQNKEIAEIKEELIELKTTPIKENASKWEIIVNIIYKVLITGFVGWFLVQLGIS